METKATVIALINTTLFNSEGSLAKADVVIENGVVKQVGRSLALPPPTSVINAAGKTLIPGLINLHSHITFFPGAPEATREEVAFRSAANAARALRAGITTVRDVGGIRHIDIALRNAIENGVVPGPRLFVSGQFICMTGGHSYAYAREADGTDDVRRAVREQVKAGADLIKFMGSGGVADPTEHPEQVQFTIDELREGIDEAHRLGRKVAVHAHPHQAMKNAVLAGADFIEHATFLEDETIDLLLEHDVAIVPTFCVYDRIAKAADRPQGLRNHARRILDEKRERFAKAVKAGVRWGVGLDNGTFYPPDDITSELELLVASGIDSKEVLLAATSRNAALLGIEAEVGTIEPGKRADLVLLNDDPLKDMRHTRSPWLVIKNGELYPQDVLFQLNQSQERSVV